MSTTAVAPPDVEAAFCTYLSASTKVPHPRPAQFTRVTRAGGNQTALILGTVRLIVECWASSEADAFAAARLAWAKCWAAAGSAASGIWVTRVQLTDPVNFPDSDTTSPRYQFVASLTVALTPVEVSP